MGKFINDFISQPFLIKSVEILISTLLIFLLVHFTKVATSRRIDNQNVRYTTRKAICTMGYVLMLISALIIFSDKMSNRTVIIGAFGLGIGFALRELIQNFIGRAIIMSPCTCARTRWNDKIAIYN